MAYTIIEVEKLTGISSHTLRFWAKKGLFPFVQKDSNQIKYFANSDVQWAKFIECMRSIGMSIEDIKEYIMLCQKGVESVEQRKTMLIKQKEEILTKLQAFNLALEYLDYKISLYEQACKNKEDSLNPLNTKTIPQDCKNKKN